MLDNIAFFRKENRIPIIMLLILGPTGMKMNLSRAHFILFSIQAAQEAIIYIFYT